MNSTTNCFWRLGLCLWLAPVLAALLVGCNYTFEQRVVELQCTTRVQPDGSCGRKPGSYLKFIVNPATGAVAMEVDPDQPGNWGAGLITVWDNCNVVDQDHWRCKVAPHTGSFGMFGGEYRHYANDGDFGDHIKGDSGWRYWLTRARVANDPEIRAFPPSRQGVKP